MKPFVFKFETRKNKYIYDVNTNRVFQVSSAVYEYIDDYSEHNFNVIMKKYQQDKNTRKQLLEGWKEIDDVVKKDDLFSTHHPSQMAYCDDLSFDHIIKSSPNQHLILSVTERCNLRCSYCIYSGKYIGARRHSNRDMSYETARTAVDKFFLNASDKVNISFYGGEPLLNFELIKNIVEYTKVSYKKNINWGMTTNGTLLSTEICKFLYENNFNFAVSLDGPKEIHDRYRKFNDGKGSFDLLFANLRYLQSLDEDYYNKNVSFSVVSAPPFNFKLVNDFFSSELLVSKNNKYFSYMDDSIDGFEYTPTIEDYETLNKENLKLFEEYANGNIKGCLKGSLIEHINKNNYLRFYHRSKTPMGDRIYPNGCCLPGSLRTFVSIDHKLHICEKTDGCYEIGTVESWIDTSKIKKIFDEYIELSEDCLDCWACRLCKNCFKTFIVNGRLDKSIHKIKCENTRRSLSEMMINYYSILEENITAFDYMKDMKLD